MKKILLSIIMPLACMSTTVFAQTDSTHFDLGRAQLRKSLTQSITVKGTDLEKQPFANISEALNVWFYGSLTYKENLVYVIDGAVLNDVNAYSIYDIEEITLVQNAQTMVNGAKPFQQVILIKTKRNRTSKGGITVAGQTNKVQGHNWNYLDPYTNQYHKQPEAGSGYYHGYNISAYKNESKVRFGLSAGIMRDMQPERLTPDVGIRDDINLTRFRFNGYVNADIGSKSILDVAISYAPQNISNVRESSGANSYSKFDYDNRVKLFNTSLKLTTKISSGLKNTLYAGYNNGNDSYTGTQVGIFGSANNTSYFSGYHNTRLFNIYDRIDYTKRLGDFSIESSLNINYRRMKDSINTGDVNSSYRQWFKRTTWLLTPSLGFFYKDAIGLQGGVVYDMSKLRGLAGNKATKVYPFVNISADVMRLADSAAKVSIKIYGSYAASNNFGDQGNLLYDLGYIPLADGYAHTNSNNATTFMYGSKAYKTYTAGISIAPVGDKVTISYLFEKRDFESNFIAYVPNFGSTLVSSDVDAKLHHINVAVNVLSGSVFNWKSAINATALRQKFLSSNRQTGDNMWTGGWANRIAYKQFSAGIDLLYRFGKGSVLPHISQDIILTSIKDNSLSLQNIYLGYKLNVDKSKLEVFANARNLYQNDKSTITDNRKYYGLGFKLEI